MIVRPRFCVWWCNHITWMDMVVRSISNSPICRVCWLNMFKHAGAKMSCGNFDNTWKKHLAEIRPAWFYFYAQYVFKTHNTHNQLCRVIISIHIETKPYHHRSHIKTHGNWLEIHSTTWATTRIPIEFGGSGTPSFDTKIHMWRSRELR